MKFGSKKRRAMMAHVMKYIKHLIVNGNLQPISRFIRSDVNNNCVVYSVRLCDRLMLEIEFYRNPMYDFRKWLSEDINIHIYEYSPYQCKASSLLYSDLPNIVMENFIKERLVYAGVYNG